MTGQIFTPVEAESNKNSLSNLLEEFNILPLPGLFYICKILFYALQKYFETNLSLSITRSFSSSCTNIWEQVQLFPREGRGVAARYLVANMGSQGKIADSEQRQREYPSL